ncbi:MAG: hypothetical protein LiPW30_142 [Parcubacteria group bacterium LiPW_30]|nr:MAG: hypothetical protein LiPW30_142 [Parcubacteria group bacterium LiPW_30]
MVSTTTAPVIQMAIPPKTTATLAPVSTMMWSSCHQCVSFLCSSCVLTCMKYINRLAKRPTKPSVIMYPTCISCGFAIRSGASMRIIQSATPISKSALRYPPRRRSFFSSTLVLARFDTIMETKLSVPSTSTWNESEMRARLPIRIPTTNSLMKRPNEIMVSFV